jgi:hypothetical protein
MGSKTPITHDSSYFIPSVIDFRMGHQGTASRASPIERPAGEFLATYDPRCAPDCICLGGQTTAPHHLSGPPPPAKAGFEFARVAVPTASAATASMIASDVFMSRLLSDRR